MSRPEPGWLAPRGWHHEVVANDNWDTPAHGADVRCRATASRYRRACGRPAVATLWRTTWKGRRVPWGYCERHLYDTWIEDGQVVSWRLVKDEA